MAIDFVRINGNDFSAASVTLKIDGQVFYGLKELNFADKRERGKAYALARHRAPTRRTSGKYSTEPVKMKLYASSAALLRKYLAQKSSTGRSYGNPAVPIVVTYAEDNLSPHVIEIQECCVSDDGAAYSDDNDDPAVVDVGFDCMRIYRDGLCLFDDSKGAP